MATIGDGKLILFAVMLLLPVVTFLLARVEEAHRKLDTDAVSVQACTYGYICCLIERYDSKVFVWDCMHKCVIMQRQLHINLSCGTNRTTE